MNAYQGREAELGAFQGQNGSGVMKSVGCSTKDQVEIYCEMVLC